MDNEIQGLNRDVIKQRAQKNNAMEQARIAQLRAAAEAEWPRRRRCLKIRRPFKYC